MPTRPALARKPRAPFSFAAPVVEGAAPFDELVEALEEVAGEEGDEAGVFVGAAGEDGPAAPADDAASTSCWMVELKVPDIPVSVNLAENASAGYWGFFGSLRLSDSKRMKLQSASAARTEREVRWRLTSSRRWGRSRRRG